ncbi:hypothetical protein AHMF7605_26980 [Adhaeribacter arboris]|uniref:Lipocalin-like domain-containing protein n=1 Tax=Adhaeribacter arboris TaxID=2072846 RepID=A0A2T2YN04_9BACT|nr:hypothetical protein [Adhaeribacter arboris]PSR56881.1 hypothetical protein AHMF7605_26980 [Adhaeribacter arboris]
MYKLYSTGLIALLITFCSCAEQGSLQHDIKPLLFGKYVDYTKNRKCEIVERSLNFNSDSTFSFRTTCLVDTSRVTSAFPKRFEGTVKNLNDSTIILKVEDKIYGIYKILSDTTLELQSENTYKPVYTKMKHYLVAE